VTLAPLLSCAAGLLAVAGVMKLRAPGAASGALASLSMPVAAPVVRLAAACEIALGAWALAAPGRLAAALVAAVYAGFALLVLGLLARPGARARGCGCFGEADADVHPMHLVLNVLAAGVALGAVAEPPRSLLHIAAGSPALGLVLCAGVAAAVYATYLLYTVAPAAWHAYGGRAG